MSARTEDLWGLFLEEARLLVDRLRDDARAIGAATSGRKGDVAAALRDMASAFHTLAVSAALIGVEEISGVCRAASRILAESMAGHIELPVPALSEAVGKLADAVLFLSRPDRSGARLEGTALPEILARLEALAPAGRSLSPAQSPAREEGDDTRWVPQVDDDMIDPFIDECTERLEGLATKLIRLEESPGDVSLVNEIFRDLHTVKGSSGFVGLRRMNRLSHAAEDLVGQVRQGTRMVDRAVIDALLQALDVLRAILDRAMRRAPVDVSIEEVIARLRSPGAMGAPDSPGLSTSDGVTAALVSPQGGQKALRVDFAKLDLLMNLVGELVLGKARVHAGLQGLEALGRELESQRRVARRAAQPGMVDQRSELREIADELGRVKRVFEELGQELEDASGRIDFVSSELRDQVMKLRMVPIGRVFTKYRRTVRELALGLGKKVQLVVEGAETELDKLVVEELDEPLTHLVRNSIDHGLELPDVRKAAGKSETGTLTLRAYHRGNQIVVVVEDDGAGIDVERVKRKAVEKGLISGDEAAEMDERRALELIFRPGFSTAVQVTDLSGRGVGMDVVRETISRLKGTIEIKSDLGRGARIILRLPLTLAIIKVLLVRAAGEIYALPIDVVARTLAAPRESIRAVARTMVLHDREQEIPLIDLREVLGLGGIDAHPAETVHVAVVEVGGDCFGLACDMLLGQQEIVIKSMGDLLQEVPGAAGATLIGDRCVVILDVPALVAMARGVSGVSQPPPRPSTVVPTAASGVQEGRAPEVLLAEDSDTVRQGMKRLLEQTGCRVTEARDGAEALAIALSSRTRFDLITTDVMMPNLDGYELCRRLRETEAYREVPIVMVTSRSEKIDRIRGFDVGVDEYIIKPLDRAELIRAIRKFLGR